MKRNYIFLGLFFILAFSCQKKKNSCSEHHEESPSHLYENVAIPINSATSRAASYQWQVKVGHAAAGCSGCVTHFGQDIHIDCMGAGNACDATASVVLSAVAQALYSATTTDADELTSEVVFLMPARSLYVGMNGNKEIWLNVPEQIATREVFTEQFEFDGLFFTDYPVYRNE